VLATGRNRVAKNNLLLLGNTSNTIPASRAAKGDDGLVRRRFVKEIAHVGTYQHPKDGWTLDVNRDRLKQWADTFAAMSANGVKVEVPVDHSFKAEDVRGYVVDMYVHNDTLYGVHEMIGDDAIRLVQRCQTTSPYIEMKFTDGTGKAYGEAIVHNAIVQGPVIPGQEPFKAIAASRNASVLLSTNQGNQQMQIKDLLAGIATLIGKDAEQVTTDNVMAMLQTHLNEMTGKLETADKALAERDAKIQKLEAMLKEAEASDGKKPEPDDDTVEILAEGGEQLIDNLTNNGNVTPAVAASLKRALVGETGRRNAYALSARYSGRATSLVKEIADILRQNDPKVLGEATAAQSMRLSNVHVGASADETKQLKQLQDQMVNAAYGNQAG